MFQNHVLTMTMEFDCVPSPEDDEVPVSVAVRVCPSSQPYPNTCLQVSSVISLFFPFYPFPLPFLSPLQQHHSYFPLPLIATLATTRLAYFNFS